MKKWVEDTYNPAIDKTIYIPIWQDENLVKPIKYEENNFVVDHNFQDKFIVQYSGNMGLWNDMKTFGSAVNKLSNENINFVFIGEGIRKEELLTTISKVNNRNVSYLPFQPRNQLGQILTACHIALVSLNSGLEGIAVPSKIMGILAAGIPVLALVPKNSEIALLIHENSCGEVIEPADDYTLASRILKLRDDKELRQTMGHNARNAFEKKYSTRIISDQYINLL